MELWGMVAVGFGGSIIATGLWLMSRERARQVERDRFWKKHWKKLKHDYIKKHGRGCPGRLIVKNLSADLRVRAIFRPICRHGHHECHCHQGGSHV